MVEKKQYESLQLFKDSQPQDSLAVDGSAAPGKDLLS